jgi:hypothetical protein
MKNTILQKQKTHEEIQIRFDLNKTPNLCVPCLYNEDTIYTNPLDNLNLSNFRRVPGLIYRADNIFAPPSVSIRDWPLGVGLTYFRPQILYVPEPWMVTQGFLPKFKLFDTIYTVVDAGPVLDMNGRTSETGALHETPYIVTGEPHFAKHILYLGNSLEFGSYTVKLVEVDLILSRAAIEIYRDEKLQESFWTRADPIYGFVNLQDRFPFKFYRECNDLNSNGFLDPGEATRIVHVQEDIYQNGVFDKWVVHHIEKGVWLGRLWEYYIDDQNDAWYLFRVVDFAISSTQVFTDDQGDGVEVEVYWLENKKYWYNQVCCDPWSRNPEKNQLFLDAYQAGWDHIQLDGDSYEYQPPGTGLTF